MSKKKGVSFTIPAAAPRGAASPLALQMGAQQLFGQGRYAEAAQLCRQLVAMQPAHAGAWQMLGMAALMQEAPKDALSALERAHQLDARNTQTLCLLGVARLRLGQPEEAVASFDAALALAPTQAGIHYDRATALMQLGRSEEALAGFERALTLAPDMRDGWMNRGITLGALGRHTEAIASLERALDLSQRAGAPKPACGTPQAQQLVKIWRYLAAALYAAGRNPDALGAWEQALALNEKDAEIWLGMGKVLAALGRNDLAIERYQRACALAPGEPELHRRLGSALARERARVAEAVAELRTAHELAPGSAYLAQQLMYQSLRIAHWDGLPALLAQTQAAVRSQSPSMPAFAFLSHPQATAADVLAVARASDPVLPVGSAPAVHTRRSRRERLRVGYLSSDFREHPVSYLMTGVFEAHDKARFETYGFSIYPQPDASPRRQRIEAAMDHFFDLHKEGDEQVARIIAAQGIDILVDLAGHTTFGRTRAVARRPAPVQVNYLGFPATSGMKAVDYILADAIVAPPGSEGEFSEAVVRLPECFQANDGARARPLDTPTREALGLPTEGLVFCCFCNSYKINPGLFDLWCRVLAAVPGSVLWLVADEPEAEGNFRAHAAARGVDGARLIFAPRVGYEDYLARYRAAGLFLDTLPFGGGTTASDALWMGLPVLTQPGAHFAGRMAASLLTNLGVPELIVPDAAAYEALAIALAREPQRLAALRQRIEEQRTRAPLFNTERFTRHMERAYDMMWARFEAGLPPAAINVPPLEEAMPSVP